MKILFLVPYPLRESPSQRFRFEQYFNVLAKHDNKFHVQSFLDSNNWKVFYNSKGIINTIPAILKGFLKRSIILFKVHRYEIVFIHREVAPIGPPIFEWIISKILRKKIIYDFDDAIWLTDRRDESILFRILKWRSKVRSICKWSYKVSCGNDYLCLFAQQFNNHVVYNPTTIDTEDLHNPALYKKANSSDKITIGWTGSHSTLKYLTDFVLVLQLLEKKYDQLQIHVISDSPPNLNLKRLHHKSWAVATEIVDLAQFDIGIMPLPNDEWAKGKCGFKALQYMALQIPTVASPVGVNTQIILPGENGFLCSAANEWANCLSILIENKALRDSMGKTGRKNVIDHYSVSSNTSNFLSLFS